MNPIVVSARHWSCFCRWFDGQSAFSLKYRQAASGTPRWGGRASGVELTPSSPKRNIMLAASIEAAAGGGGGIRTYDRQGALDGEMKKQAKHTLSSGAQTGDTYTVRDRQQV